MATQAQLKAAFEIVVDIYEIIKAKGDEGMPSGHLYAHLMSVLPLSAYQQIIDILKSTGKVREASHVLYAVA